MLERLTLPLGPPFGPAMPAFFHYVKFLVSLGGQTWFKPHPQGNGDGAFPKEMFHRTFKPQAPSPEPCPPALQDQTFMPQTPNPDPHFKTSFSHHSTATSRPAFQAPNPETRTLPVQNTETRAPNPEPQPESPVRESRSPFKFPSSPPEPRRGVENPQPHS